MTTTHVYSRHALWLGLLLLAGGCERGAVKEGVQDLKEAQREATGELKEQLENAKQGAARLKQKMPAVGEDIKQEAREVRDELKENLHTAGNKLEAVGERVKDEAKDAVDAVRGE